MDFDAPPLRVLREQKTGKTGTVVRTKHRANNSERRQRVTEKIIEEVNELHRMGFRYIVFADDTFNPATLGRIARESSPHTRRDLERVREERLQFFDEYDRGVPNDMHAFTQMTSEIVTDDEYLSAITTRHGSARRSSASNRSRNRDCGAPGRSGIRRGERW